MKKLWTLSAIILNILSFENTFFEAFSFSIFISSNFLYVSTFISSIFVLRFSFSFCKFFTIFIDSFNFELFSSKFFFVLFNSSVIFLISSSNWLIFSRSVDLPFSLSCLYSKNILSKLSYFLTPAS